MRLGPRRNGRRRTRSGGVVLIAVMIVLALTGLTMALLLKGWHRFHAHLRQGPMRSIGRGRSTRGGRTRPCRPARTPSACCPCRTGGTSAGSSPPGTCPTRATRRSRGPFACACGFGPLKAAPRSRSWSGRKSAARLPLIVFAVIPALAHARGIDDRQQSILVAFMLFRTVVAQPSLS